MSSKNCFLKNEYVKMCLGGLLAGILFALLSLWGNPKNMGFCIACFIRDTAGALHLHEAGKLAYVRPEIVGLILGSFAISTIAREHKAVAGSNTVIRFVLGMLVMTGCLMFMGCPLRMILRLAGGDLNALMGLVGFIPGILTGVVFLNKGFSLGRNKKINKAWGYLTPGIFAVIFVLFLTVPSLFNQSTEGPGSMHAPIFVSLIAGIVLGIMFQRMRLCLAGGIRDIALFKDYKLILGFIGVFAGTLLTNIILTMVTDVPYVMVSFEGQSLAHTNYLWNALGMYLVGFGSILLGGCPLRQIILSGEGNCDSAVTILGYIAGAALCHIFNLASGGDGPTIQGRIAVTVGIIIVLAIAVIYTKRGRK